MSNSKLANADVRSEMKRAGVALWQIADALDVCEMTMTRKLRREMDEPAKREIYALIANLSAKQGEVTDDGASSDRQ